MRTIDADALLERIKKDPLFPLVENYGISGVIKAEPTVDAEPVRHGHWVVHTDKWASGDEYFGYAECSECGDMFYAVETIGIKPIWDYCPSCGAKMDERKEE